MKFKDEYWVPHPVKAVLVAIAFYIAMSLLSGCVKQSCMYPEYHYQEWLDGALVEDEHVIFDAVLDSTGISHYLMIHYSVDADSSRLDFKGFKSVECL